MEVEVEASEETPAEVEQTVVVVPESDGGNDAVWQALTALTERVGALEAAVVRTAEVAVDAAITAEVAEAEAEQALAEVAEVAAETEEALATVAEEAEVVTPEVVAEVEDVAPDREHPWFAGRRVLKRSDASE